MFPESRTGGPAVGHARARKVAAQLVEDEDYQLRYERVAGIDVAKAKADVCTRLPPAREGGRRVSRVETVAATAREVLALAGRLIADGVEVVVMESTSVTGGSGITCWVRHEALCIRAEMEGLRRWAVAAVW